MSSTGPIFRIFNPRSKAKEETVEKRREQVRRAQHVYRQRKTRYIKTLEMDLATSRRRECQISIEKKDLEDEVQALVLLLNQHGVFAPELSALRAAQQLSPGQSELSSSSQHYSAVSSHPEWPQRSTIWSSPFISPFSNSSNDHAPISGKIHEFNQTSIGMAFVLKIEEPCLGHIHGDPARPDDPSGHALTATSQLLCMTSSSPPKRSSLLPVHDAPAIILDRLLTLAPEVSCEGDVTPIQAWDELRRKPVLKSLDLRCVIILAERLRDAAKCHGFGAVVDYAVFQQLLAEVMASNITFGTL